MGPVPGLKVFFRVQIVVKMTLGPGTGPVPGFFWFFLHFLHGLYVYFLVLKKNLVDNQLWFSRFCPIKSSFNDISYLDITMYISKWKSLSRSISTRSNFIIRRPLPSDSRNALNLLYHSAKSNFCTTYFSVSFLFW